VEYTPRMRRCSFGVVAWLVVASAAVGLGVSGCHDDADDIRASVTILVNHEGALAMTAAEHLQRYGRRAIPTIEAAMHTASVPGRKNLVLALRKIGDAEAVPLLGHVAQHDTSPDVRREAEWTLRQWAGDGKAPERATRAKQAVRGIEEERGVQDAG
jgi:HEAT repeat protein